MKECFNCGHYNSDYECCTCPSSDMWYSCPIEAKKPENQEELRKMAEWYSNRR